MRRCTLVWESILRCEGLFKAHKLFIFYFGFDGLHVLAQSSLQVLQFYMNRICTGLSGEESKKLDDFLISILDLIPEEEAIFPEYF